jgi:hypothetical protein
MKNVVVLNVVVLHILFIFIYGTNQYDRTVPMCWDKVLPPSSEVSPHDLYPCRKNPWGPN